MKDLTTKDYARLAIDAAINEIVLEAAGDFEEIAMGISLFPRHSAEDQLQGLLDSLTRYAREGIPTGDFLTAVLQNDLKEAFARADNFSRWAMFAIVKHVYNKMPALCQGSPAKVEAWLKMHARLRRQRAWEPGKVVAYVPAAGKVEIGEFKGWAEREGRPDYAYAWVYYHLGDTTANTAAEDLHEIGTVEMVALMDARGFQNTRQLSMVVQNA